MPNSAILEAYKEHLWRWYSCWIFTPVMTFNTTCGEEKYVEQEDDFSLLNAEAEALDAKL